MIMIFTFLNSDQISMQFILYKMIAFLFTFPLPRSSLSDYNLPISLSGLYRPNYPFSSKPFVGFHSCPKRNFNFISDFRDKQVELVFSKENSTHYIDNHCPQAPLYKNDIDQLIPLVKHGYFHFFIKDWTINSTVRAGQIDSKNNHTYLHTQFLLSLSSNGDFKVEPIESLDLDGQTFFMLNTTFHLKLDDNFDDHLFQTTRLKSSNFYITCLSLISLIVLIIISSLFSAKIRKDPINQLSNFYTVSIFLQNTLIFSTNGFILIIQIFLYFFFKHDQPFNFQFFQNLMFLSLILPTCLHVYQLVIFNSFVNEAEFVASSFGTTFFTHAPLAILFLLNYFLFHSFCFLGFFEFFFRIISYLLVLYVVSRGIGYFIWSIFPKSYELPFITLNENKQLRRIRFPNIFSLILYGLFVTFLFSMIANYILDCVLNDSHFNISEVFPIFVLILSTSGIFSAVRTYYRTKSNSEDSWQEDHLLYSCVSAIFVSIYMLCSALFSGKITSFEHLIYLSASIYFIFGLVFNTSTAISFLTAFFQCYFSIIRKRMLYL